MTGDVCFDDVPIGETTTHDIRALIDRELGFSPGREDVDRRSYSHALCKTGTFHPYAAVPALK